MDNTAKLNKIFCEIFSVDASRLGSGFDSGSVEGWDSVRQLNLTTAMEDEFDLIFDPEDILSITSYENAKSALERNGIVF